MIKLFLPLIVHKITWKIILFLNIIKYALKFNFEQLTPKISTHVRR